MSADKNQRFAALPLRALRDQRLTLRHFRLLAIVAAHDQLNKNGEGCYASQRRLAALLGVQESRVSNTLSELRDLGYIDSTIHPTNRRRRIHRVVYNDQDKTWDRDTCPPGKASSSDTYPPGQVSGGRYLTETAPILDRQREKFGASENDPKNLGLVTYVQTYKKDNNTVDRTDRAEARNRSNAVADAEKYLTELEALAASSDRDHLKFERARIAQLADDACLPEALNERASRLLSQCDNA